MRKALTLFTFLLITSGVIAAQEKNHRERAGLKGPVKQFKLERTVITQRAGKEEESARTLLLNLSFDRRGNMTRQMLNDQSGRRRWQFGWASTYDLQGREIRKDFYSAAGVLTSTGITHYDDHARTASVTYYNPNGSVNHIRGFVFDERSRKVRETIRYPDGSGLQQSFAYDANGSLIEEVSEKLDGSDRYRTLWTYDDHGNVNSVITHKPDGSFNTFLKLKSSYDSDGKEVERINYNTDGSMKNKETFTYEFDDYGNWIRKDIRREVFKGDASTFEREVNYRRISYFGEARLAKAAH